MLALVVILPLVWIVLTSFKTDGDAIRNPYSAFPNPFSIDAYPTLASGQQPIFRWFLNSLAAAALQTVLILVTASMGAYALARLEFAGKKIVFGLIISTLLVPPVIFLIPNYLIVQNLGWLDTHLGDHRSRARRARSASSSCGSSSSGCRLEIEEAARIDGAGDFRIFLQIVLPLARPALATLAVLSFLANWNDFLWPVYVLLSPENLTLQPGLSQLQGAYSTHFAIVMAGAVIASVPVLILFFASRSGRSSRASATQRGQGVRRSPGAAARGGASLGARCRRSRAARGVARARRRPSAAVDRAASDRRATSPTRACSSSATRLATRTRRTPRRLNVQVATSRGHDDAGRSSDQRRPARAARPGRYRGKTWAPGPARSAPTAASSCTSRRRTPQQAASASASPSRDKPEGPFSLDRRQAAGLPVDEGGAIDAEHLRRRRRPALPGVEERRQLLRLRHVDQSAQPLSADGALAHRRADPADQADRVVGGHARRGARSSSGTATSTCSCTRRTTTATPRM